MDKRCKPALTASSKISDGNIKIQNEHSNTIQHTMPARSDNSMQITGNLSTNYQSAIAGFQRKDIMNNETRNIELENVKFSKRESQNNRNDPKSLHKYGNFNSGNERDYKGNQTDGVTTNNITIIKISETTNDTIEFIEMSNKAIDLKESKSNISENFQSMNEEFEEIIFQKEGKESGEEINKEICGNISFCDEVNEFTTDTFLNNEKTAHRDEIDFEGNRTLEVKKESFDKTNTVIISKVPLNYALNNSNTGLLTNIKYTDVISDINFQMNGTKRRNRESNGKFSKEFFAIASLTVEKNKSRTDSINIKESSTDNIKINSKKTGIPKEEETFYEKRNQSNSTNASNETENNGSTTHEFVIDDVFADKIDMRDSLTDAVEIDYKRTRLQRDGKEYLKKIVKKDVTNISFGDETNESTTDALYHNPSFTDKVEIHFEKKGTSQTKNESFENINENNFSKVPLDDEIIESSVESLIEKMGTHQAENESFKKIYKQTFSNISLDDELNISNTEDFNTTELSFDGVEINLDVSESQQRIKESYEKLYEEYFNNADIGEKINTPNTDENGTKESMTTKNMTCLALNETQKQEKESSEKIHEQIICYVTQGQEINETNATELGANESLINKIVTNSKINETQKEERESYVTTNKGIFSNATPDFDMNVFNADGLRLSELTTGKMKTDFESSNTHCEEKPSHGRKNEDINRSDIGGEEIKIITNGFDTKKSTTNKFGMSELVTDRFEVNEPAVRKFEKNVSIHDAFKTNESSTGILKINESIAHLFQIFELTTNAYEIDERVTDESRRLENEKNKNVNLIYKVRDSKSNSYATTGNILAKNQTNEQTVTLLKMVQRSKDESKISEEINDSTVDSSQIYELITDEFGRNITKVVKNDENKTSHTVYTQNDLKHNGNENTLPISTENDTNEQISPLFQSSLFSSDEPKGSEVINNSTAILFKSYALTTGAFELDELVRNEYDRNVTSSEVINKEVEYKNYEQNKEIEEIDQGILLSQEPVDNMKDLSAKMQEIIEAVYKELGIYKEPYKNLEMFKIRENKNSTINQWPIKPTAYQLF